MKKTLICAFLMLSGCGGGSQNFCSDPNSYILDLTVTSTDCTFFVPDSFRVCTDATATEVTIANFLSSGETLNCLVGADTNNHVSTDVACSFDIDSAGESYVCYAGITDQAELTGSIYCDPGVQDDGVIDGCAISYE